MTGRPDALKFDWHDVSQATISHEGSTYNVRVDGCYGFVGGVAS